MDLPSIYQTTGLPALILFLILPSTCIRTSIYDKYSGSTKITTHLDYISRCKTASGTNWLNRWTYRVFDLAEHLPRVLLVHRESARERERERERARESEREIEIERARERDREIERARAREKKLRDLQHQKLQTGEKTLMDALCRIKSRC